MELIGVGIPPASLVSDVECWHLLQMSELNLGYLLMTSPVHSRYLSVIEDVCRWSPLVTSDNDAD